MYAIGLVTDDHTEPQRLSNLLGHKHSNWSLCCLSIFCYETMLSQSTKVNKGLFIAMVSFLLNLENRSLHLDCRPNNSLWILKSSLLTLHLTLYIWTKSTRNHYSVHLKVIVIKIGQLLKAKKWNNKWSTWNIETKFSFLDSSSEIRGSCYWRYN